MAQDDHPPHTAALGFVAERTGMVLVGRHPKPTAQLNSANASCAANLDRKLSGGNLSCGLHSRHFAASAFLSIQ